MPDFIDLDVKHYNTSTEEWETVSTTGVVSIRCKERLNAPREITIVFSNIKGKRAFTIARGDRIKVNASPVSWTTGSSIPKPPVFYGFCLDVESTDKQFTVLGIDTLGWLTNDILLTNPTSIFTGADGADVMKDILVGSNYDLNDSLAWMLNETRIIVPTNIKLTGNTRLAGMQTILNLINATSNLFRLKGNLQVKRVELDRLPAVSDSTVVPYLAGRFPKTSAPLDIVPTYILREEDEDDLVNLVTIKNESLDLTVTEPIVTPPNPIHRLFNDSSVTDETSARLLARQILNQAGYEKTRWEVEAIPNRLDIVCGDIIDFQSIEGGLSGKQMVFSVSWEMTPDDTTMALTVGRQTPDFLTAIRFAAGQSI